MRRSLLRAAAVILAARLMWMYVIPAWYEITTDFQNYYTAAWAVRHGRPLMDLYDPLWFQHESERAGLEGQTALFNYFTPFSALVMWPFANLTPLLAKRIWIVLNLVTLTLTVLLIARFLNASRMTVLLVALLGGDALGNNFTFGQFYVLLTLMLVLAVILLERQPAVAGWCLALVTAVKVFPAVFIAYFACLGRWRVVAWTLAGMMLCGLLALTAMGWIPHRVYMEEVLPRAIRGEIQDPYNVRWNTLQALLRRALVAEPGLNPHPIADIPLFYFFLRTFVVVSILSFTFAALRRRPAGLIEYGGIIAAISLITPSQASYHQVLFFPAVAAAIHFHRDVRTKMIFALAFALICSNYMGVGTRWDSGIEMLLAFPRVYLVLGLWTLFLFLPFEYAFPKREGARLPFRGIIAVAALLTIISVVLEWRRWQADQIDGATMARPEAHGLLEVHPTLGSNGLIFSALRPEGYTIIHPSAFGSGLVYESHGVIHGRLPDKSTIGWPGALEPALGSRSVVALREDGRTAVERTADDPDWRELFHRDTVIHDPAISPTGDTIAFSEWVNGRYRISEWSRTTGAIRTVLEGDADYRYPAYAPGRAELAFATNERGNWDIVRYSFDTDQRRVITSSRANDLMPAYSLDGKQIYFASDRRRGYRFTAIYSIAAGP